jgi:Protein of unknown function (DUF3431)
MISPKRAAPLLCIVAFTLTLMYLRSQNSSKQWRDVPPIFGEGDFIPEGKAVISGSLLEEPLRRGDWAARPFFVPGTPKPNGSNYTRMLVIPRTTAEDVSWIDEENLHVIKAIYVVDEPKSELKTPKNKGREVMVYLTYIIDHYDVLPDISIFMHAHRWSWHNNEILNNDAAEMIRRLSSEKVIREGFMNMRCHWNPGCPDWMHPGVVEDDMNKHEENLMVRCWAELFPGEAAPTLLAQPCCAQFAVSRERIRAVPLARWSFYRDWLLRTELSDFLSGRIWEYLWQVAFTGEAYVCRDEHECYCDGYGICFDDKPAYDRYFEARGLRSEYQGQLDAYWSRIRAWERFRESGWTDRVEEMEEPGSGKDEELRVKVEELDRELEEKRQGAVQRGTDARFRAQIAGRAWEEGDGF